MQAKKHQPIADQRPAQPQAQRQLKMHQKRDVKPGANPSSRLSVRHVAVLGYN